MYASTKSEAAHEQAVKSTINTLDFHMQTHIFGPVDSDLRVGFGLQIKPSLLFSCLGIWWDRIRFAFRVHAVWSLSTMCHFARFVMARLRRSVSTGPSYVAMEIIKGWHLIGCQWTSRWFSENLEWYKKTDSGYRGIKYMHQNKSFWKIYWFFIYNLI